MYLLLILFYYFPHNILIFPVLLIWAFPCSSYLSLYYARYKSNIKTLKKHLSVMTESNSLLSKHTEISLNLHIYIQTLADSTGTKTQCSRRINLVTASLMTSSITRGGVCVCLSNWASPNDFTITCESRVVIWKQLPSQMRNIKIPIYAWSYFGLSEGH